MEFIEFLKNLFGGNKKSGNLDDMKSEIAAMEEKPETEKPKLPDGPAYERIEYEPPTDEALQKRAREEYEAYRRTAEKAIAEEKAAAEAKLNREKAAADDKAAADRQAVDAAYDRADEQTANDTLKRGVARSSIAVNRMADLAKARADERTAVEKGYSEKLAALDGEIGSLEAKRQQALNDFNITLAAKITARINELTDERTNKQNEAIRYNNGLAEKEAAYEVDKTMKESDLYGEQLSQTEKENELEKKYGTNTEKRYAAVYDKMRGTLAGMSAAEARDAVRNDTFFTDNLSQYWYYKLYDEFGR